MRAVTENGTRIAGRPGRLTVTHPTNGHLVALSFASSSSRGTRPVLVIRATNM